MIRIPRTKGQLYHVHKGTPYHVENSLRGVREAAKLGYVGIDLDANADACDVVWATHWGRPLLRDGFRDPLGRLSRFAQVHTLTSGEVARLRTPGDPRYRIQTAGRLIKAARRRGLLVELEAKSSPPLYGRRAWLNLAEELDGATKDNLLVKVLLDLGPNPENRLRAAHAAGFRTVAIQHGGRRVQPGWAPFVDFYR